MFVWATLRIIRHPPRGELEAFVEYRLLGARQMRRARAAVSALGEARRRNGRLAMMEGVLVA